MENCIFCKIIAGEIPCYKVYEDELFLGFLDIAPRTRGHSLLIPKKHYTWVYDVPEIENYWKAAHKLTITLKTALSPYFISYATHGLEVPHAHIHIIPRTKTDTAFVPPVITINKDDMEKIARKIYKTS